MRTRSLAAVLAVTLLTLQQGRADDGRYYSDKVPSHSEELRGYSMESQMAKFESLPIQSIEGIWEYPNEMMTVAVERFASPHISPRIAYRIVLLESDDSELLPGTVVGYAAESVDRRKFELWIYSERNLKQLQSPVHCVATLSEEVLTFVPMKDFNMRVRVNLTRFLPTLFRGISVYPQVDEETLPVGFRRIYPASGKRAEGNMIRYL